MLSYIRLCYAFVLFFCFSSFCQTATDEVGRITALDLSRNRLRGSLPYDGIGRLMKLKDLRMCVLCCWLGVWYKKSMDSLRELHDGCVGRRGNDLLGRIPRDLGALTCLVHLDLSRNRLAGYACVIVPQS